MTNLFILLDVGKEINKKVHRIIIFGNLDMSSGSILRVSALFITYLLQRVDTEPLFLLSLELS